MKNSSLSSRVSRLASFVGAASCRVILPLALAAAMGLAALPAQARYVPANWNSLPTLTGGAGETLAAGEYRVTSDITYSEQLAIADNATVTLWFANKATLTADLSAKTTGQAGIKLPSTSTLILRSADNNGGAVVAKGAAGAKAADGENGVTKSDLVRGYATGGNGGAGATGGGAGIGGNGGAGGASGYRGDAGKNLKAGQPGKGGGRASAGAGCGRLFVFDGVTVTAAGGNGGAKGAGGAGGGSTFMSYVGGGGGGGGGGAGGNAPAIGGGAGGGGGGGGGGGSQHDGGSGGGGGGLFGGGGGGGNHCSMGGANGRPGSDGQANLAGGAGGVPKGTCGGSGNGGGGGTGGSGAFGGAGGYRASYAAQQITDATPARSETLANDGAASSLGRKVTFDLGGQSVQAGYDAYTLAIETSVAPTPIVAPVPKGDAQFFGYYTEAKGGALIINADGTPTGAAIGATNTVLHARWSEMFVNGESVYNGGGTGWQLRDGTKLYLTNAMDYVISGRNVLGELAIYVNKAGVVVTLDNVMISNANDKAFNAYAYGGGKVTLLLKGANALRTSAVDEKGNGQPGIALSSSTELVIGAAPDAAAGSCSLTVTGGGSDNLSGAGIGTKGAQEFKLDGRGIVRITGGRIETVGGLGAAGLGAGCQADAPQIFIEGGTLVARTNGVGSCAIGGSYGCKSISDVTITGGSVVAGAIANAPTNAVGEAVYEVLVPASGTSSVLEPINFTYGTEGLVAVDGYLHLWLPARDDYDFYVDGRRYNLSVTPSGSTLTTPASATVTNARQLRGSLAAGLSVALGCDFATDDETIEFSESVAGKEIVLDLAGHVLTHTNALERLFTLASGAKGCTFTIRDSSAGQTGVVRYQPVGTYEGEAPFLALEGETTFVLESGTVSGFATTGKAGAVSVGDSATFVLAGGTIENCSADCGGAVYVKSDAAAFVLTNGMISSCTAAARGGALYMDAGDALICGGTITNCTAEGGGAIQLMEGGRVTMTGGELLENSAQSGGTVSTDAHDPKSTAFEFLGGRIASTPAAGMDGGILIWRASTFAMDGGTLEGARSETFSMLHAEKDDAFISLNTGLLSDETVTNAENRATLPAGYTLASFAGVEGTRYIVASNATFNTDGELNGGTLRFDPRSEPYESAGLKVAEGFAVVKVNRTEWTLREEYFTVNGTPMSAGAGTNPDWNIDGDGDLHLTSENGAYVLAGVADSVRVSAEANGQNVTLGGFTNTCSESETYAVGAGVASNTICLAGINALAATGAGEPAISVADGATLSIGAKEGVKNGAKNGFLFAQGGESSAAICGKGSRVAINGGTMKANGGFDASGVGTGIDAAEVFAADGMVVRAGTDEDPIDEVEHASEKTDIAGILVGQCFVTATPSAEIPTEPILAEPTVAPANATLAVYTNGVLSAETSAGSGVWNAWSNQTAEVVYRANEGYRFANGETVVTNTLDTTTDPAVNAAGEVPPTSTGKPTVLLGVVAQRYPWNGWLDIQYKTPYADADATVVFKATVGAEVIELGKAKGTCNQAATVSFDLNTAAGGAFKDKQLKSVKITATIK